jgi:uncharacterized protein YecT (DUF1311 family)
MFPTSATCAEAPQFDEEWAAQHCAHPASLGEQEISTCMAYAYRQADAKLNALYKELKALSPPEAWKRLVADERAWIQQRDETCRAESGPEKTGPGEQGGTSHPLYSREMNRCLTRLTNERIKTFEAMSAQLPKHAESSASNDTESSAQKRPLTFAGGWTAWMCPPRVEPDPEKCANLGIYLYERHGQLCGAHTFATANATRLDEGGAPSILGKLNGPQAEVIVESGRSEPPVHLRVQISFAKEQLHWKIVGAEPSHGGSGEYLVPEDVWLRRDDEPVFSKEFAAELKAACESPSPSFSDSPSNQPGSPSN